MNQRLLQITEYIIGEYQAGFRPGRSTNDEPFSIKEFLRIAWKYDNDQLFVDFRQAYGSSDMEKLYRKLDEVGLPYKFVKLIKITMEDIQSSVKIQNQFTNSFSITKGPKQGDGLAPVLLNITLIYVIRRMSVNPNIHKSIQIAA